AGVTVVNSGQPGANNNTQLRGYSSINNSAPIYVVDGVQMSSMPNISPNDITSTEVLKADGATAIYGAAGGNGVVVITTKNGRANTSRTDTSLFVRRAPANGEINVTYQAALTDYMKQILKTDKANQ